MARTALFNRQQPGGVYTISDFVDHPGEIFFVDSGSGTDGVGYGRNPDSPVATLDYAIANLCTASQGDVIYVMPGHAENLAADSTVDMDIAGVKVIGLGSGADRPTFTCTVAAGDFKLAAASCSIENLLFLNGVDQSTGLLEVSAADCVIKNCEIREAASGSAQANVYLITTAAADRLLIDGLKVNQGGADAGPVTAIDLVGADDCEIRNCYFYGNFSTGIVQCLTTASPRIWIHDSIFWTENSADIAVVDTITASTGWIGPNLSIKLKDNAANLTAAITGATFQMVDPVYVVNLVNEKAALSTWTASAN